MKSIFKKYRIFFAAAFLLALFFCCRTLFPAFQLQHKGSESFNNFISRLFADELTSNTMNLHFTLKDPSSMGIDSYEVTFGDFSTKSQKGTANHSRCPFLFKQLQLHASLYLHVPQIFLDSTSEHRSPDNLYSGKPADQSADQK